MNEITKLGLKLLLITSVAAFILGITNDVTQVIIQERALAETKEALVALLPDADDFNVIEDGEVLDRDLVLEAYEGVKNDEVVGYTVRVNPQGYGGAVEMLIGVSADGSITGIKIGTHSETPGLGSKIADASFIDQFIDQTVEEDFAISQNVEAISGATISSTAVVKGVNAVGNLFQEVLSNR